MEQTVGIKLVAQDMASGPLARVQAELRDLGGAAGGIASGGMGLLGRAAGSVEKGLGHLKNTIGGLITGPLGFLGLTAGVLGLGGALKNGIETASNMALAIEKLTGLTGEDAAAMSGLLAVTGKFGISSDQLSTLVGFETKTLGKLSQQYETTGKASKSAALSALELRKAKLEETGASTKAIDVLIKEQTARDAVAASTAKVIPSLNKLQALQKQYGVTLTDSKGHALDFSSVLNNVSDYYNSNATAGQKAALASTVFGRGYAALIPVLKLGSKGFADAQAAAQSLGLVLTDSNEDDLKKYQETMRNLGDAVGGLELQLSLELVPAIQKVAQAATRFIADNRQGILTFFNKLIAGAQTAAGFITGTIVPDIKALAGAAIGFWNSIPAPLRDMLTKFVIADRAMRFLFGFDPVTTVGTLIGKQILGSLAAGLGLVATKAVGGLLGTAASDALGVRVFVTNMPGGFGGGNPVVAGGEDAAAGAGAGGLLAGITATQALVSVAALAATAILLVNANQGRKDLADRAARGDPVAIRTQNELATRGMGGGGTANLTGGPSGAMGMRMLPKIAEFSQQSLAAQKIANAFAAQMVQVMQSRFDKVIGITEAQKAEIQRNAQLQAVLDQTNHRLTYAQLEHQSHVDHEDHVSTLAKFDHLTMAQEQTKLAIENKKMVTNVTVTSTTSITSTGIAASQRTVNKYGLTVGRD